MKPNNSKLVRRGGLLIYNSKLLLVLSLLLSLGLSCDSTNPPSNNKLALTFEDASCTEAWLNLKTENVALPTKTIIKQDDSTVVEANISSNDTTLFVENLLPNQTYIFYSTIEQLNNETIKSNKLSITTMDTTSHNFTWETFTFGNRNSVLKDVAIINENNIWAVGEIRTEDTGKFDSNGVWVKHYNAAHWDGNTWELKRILFYTFCNQEHKDTYTANAVFVFDDGVIAITSGSQITYIENGEQKNIECIPVSVNSIWGTSSQDFYVVGSGGNIANFNGSGWTKIESGTEENLYDIYGIDDLIYAVGGSSMDYYGVLLQGNTNGFEMLKEGTASYVDTIFSPYFVGSLSSVWKSQTGTLYFGGGALYKSKNNKWDFDRTLEGNCLRCNGSGDYYASVIKIRGNAVNDIVFVGARNTVRHFNGISWKQLGDTYNPNEHSILYASVAIDNNNIIAVGRKDGEAIIIRFKK